MQSNALLGPVNRIRAGILLSSHEYTCTRVQYTCTRVFLVYKFPGIVHVYTCTRVHVYHGKRVRTLVPT